MFPSNRVHRICGSIIEAVSHRSSYIREVQSCTDVVLSMNHTNLTQAGKCVHRGFLKGTVQLETLHLCHILLFYSIYPFAVGICLHLNDADITKTNNTLVDEGGLSS